MTVHMRNLGMLCLAAIFGLYGCGEDNSSSSDSGPEATGARAGSGPISSASLDRVIRVMTADVAVLNSIQCEPPCSGMLSNEQESVLLKIKRRVRDELRRGGEIEIGAGVIRQADLVDAEIMYQAMTQAALTDQASIETWVSELEADNRSFINRTMILVVNAYARASDLPEPFVVPTATQARPLTISEDSRLGTLRQATITGVDCAAIGAGMAIVGGLTWVIDKALEYEAGDDVPITYWYCENYDYKFLDRICCGFTCYRKIDDGYKSDMCTEGDKAYSIRWRELDVDDCGDDLVTPEPPAPQDREPEPSDRR